MLGQSNGPDELDLLSTEIPAVYIHSYLYRIETTLPMKRSISCFKMQVHAQKCDEYPITVVVKCKFPNF